MKVNLEMNAPVHAADELPHQALLFLRVFVVDGVELPQKLSRAADHAEKVGILPADEGFAGEALFVFRGHDSSLFRKRRRAIDEAPGVFSSRSSLQKRRFRSSKRDFAFSYARHVSMRRRGDGLFCVCSTDLARTIRSSDFFSFFLIRIKFVRGERRGLEVERVK